MNNIGIAAEAIDYLFSSTFANNQANLDALGANVLGQGIDYYQAGKYNQAESAFRRAAALSPFSDNAVKAYDFLGKTYLKQEKTEQAIKTYQQAIRIYPMRDELHMALGDIYLQDDRHEDAMKSFEKAVRANPSSADARYSLGQSYLGAGELTKAHEQFAKVAALTPISAAGFYGMGQVARQEGDLNAAIAHLSKAIRVNRNFEIAYVELGRAYADQGEFRKAEDQVAFLTSKNSDKVTELEGHIEQARQPRFLLAQGGDGFRVSLGPKTPVSALDAKLSDPGKSKLFSMSFAFNKDMDLSSVINPYNWTISRATIRENGGVYNGGLTPPKTEALIMPKPAYVTYDESKNTATVHFRINQNQTADATLDPKHLVFKFSGIDTYGKSMDPSGDEYSGFRGIA